MKTITKIISEQREINKILDHGEYKFNVKYITVKETSTYIFGNNLWNTEQSTRSTQSNILFDTQEEAELYAKLTRCSDEPERNYTTWQYKMFLNGTEDFSEYGYFKIELICSYPVYFVFRDKYQKYLTEKIGLGDFVKVFSDIDKYINIVKKEIDKIHDSNTIVSKFDVVTLKSIPYENLKASSEELDELRRLLAQYREDQQKYQEFLEKLLAK